MGGFSSVSSSTTPPPLPPSLSVSLSTYPPIYLCFFFYDYLSASVSPPLNVSLYLSAFSRSISPPLYAPLCPSALSLSACASGCLSFYLFDNLWLSLCIYLSTLSLCLSLSLGLCVNLYPSAHYIFLSICSLSHFRPLSLSPSFFSPLFRYEPTGLPTR